MLLLSLLAFNEDNVLTSDTSEPNEWDQGHPASRSTYTTMLLLLSLLAFNDGSSCVEINLQYDALTSADVWAQWMLPGSNVEINLQREWLISTEYDVLASDVWWHSLTGVEKNLLLSKFKVKTICIDVTEVIIVPWLRGEALQGHKQPISSNQTINY